MKRLLLILIMPLFLLPAVWAQTTQDKILALIPNSTDVYRYGYQQLTADEKEVYDYLIAQIAQFEANKGATLFHRVDLDFSWTDVNINLYSLMYMLERVYRDVPELYIMNTIPRSSVSGYYARVMMTYTPEMYLEELTRIDSICTAIVNKVSPSMSDYEKLKLIHDEFVDWSDYGGMSSAYAGCIKGAFLEKRAVCEGFSRAFLMLCQRVGIPCLYVSGSLLTNPQEDEWGNHAWNFVQLDGKWYLVDITADGAFPGVCGYAGFLKGNTYFSQNYKFTMSDGYDENISNGVYLALPTLEDDDYNAVTNVELVEDEHTSLWVNNGRVIVDLPADQPADLMVYDMNGRQLIRTVLTGGSTETVLPCSNALAVLIRNGKVIKTLKVVR